MKNKNGFTLIELLGVIALLGVVALIAVPSVIGINNAINKKMLETKLDIIEEAAVQYGEQYKQTLVISDRTLEREDVKTLPIIAMTADAFTEDIKRAKDSGMNDHIAKPIDIDKLYDVMRRHNGKVGGGSNLKTYVGLC